MNCCSLGVPPLRNRALGNVRSVWLIDASADSVEELEPLIARIRQYWPAVKILLRGDGGSAGRS